MPRIRLSNKKDGASKYEVAPEPALELSFDEKGDVEVVEAKAVDFIDDYENDEDEMKIEIPLYKKRRGGMGRSEKGGDLNEALEKNLREIHSKYRKTKKSLAWDFYEPYEEDGKEADLKWYFCNFCYSKKPDKTKEGMTGMILYKKRNTSSLRNHVVTSYKIIFHTLFLTWISDQRLWLVMMHLPLMEVWIPLYYFMRLQMMSPLALVQ